MAERLIRPESKAEQAQAPEHPDVPERFALVHPSEAPGEESEAPSKSSPSARTSTVAATTAARPRSPMLQEVESILSDGLEDAYRKMDPVTQREFKEEGEIASTEIATLLESTKLKVRKILSIISRWLRMIPGVSRLFVEQEAKIKTDQLLGLHRRERGGK